SAVYEVWRYRPSGTATVVVVAHDPSPGPPRHSQNPKLFPHPAPHRSAVRLHDTERATETGVAKPFLQGDQVATDDRTNIGIEDRCRGSFVFSELAKNFMR